MPSEKKIMLYFKLIKFARDLGLQIKKWNTVYTNVAHSWLYDKTFKE